MKKARAHLLVEGLVQGVFFRARTAETANRHGVTGWVRNNPDGTVEALIEGEEGSVKDVVEWCRKGPQGARVTGMNTRWEEYTGEFDDFSIQYRY
ncbi:MAG: acylphosphatase [Thermodesulfobacteriota bacterium]